MQVVHTGTIETAEINNLDFERQRRKYLKEGTVQDPSDPETTVGTGKILKASAKKKRLEGGDAADVEGFLGPWAGYAGERKGEAALVAPTEEEVHKFVQEKSLLAPTTLVGEIAMGEEKSAFHGRAERNHLGHTYMSPPAETALCFDKEAGSFECFVPKKNVHTWTGHTKGISSIRFIPKTGHLLLSAGQDQRIKLWSVYGERECLRTFYGHNKPVREVNFSSDGSTFASCSFDKTFKVWNTETGQCTFYKDHRAIPYCVRVHPTDSNILLVGTADRKVLQWDLRDKSSSPCTEYVEHSAAINTITFFDSNKRFVTSSDDKTLRVWQYGQSTGSRLIADSSMVSMPYAVHHPSEHLIAFQSLDNRINIYSTTDTLTLRAKRFIGHATSGYACQVSFSPDGKYILSGDGRGYTVIWDWNSGAIAKRLEGHKQVCVGVEWNPQSPTGLATCSWDGTIKYWE